MSDRSGPDPPPGWDFRRLGLERTGPLSGTKVLDLTQLIAGPFCTKLLALFGSSVVKVERPDGGDKCRAIQPFAGTAGPDRSLAFLDLNVCKAGLTLDLRHSRGQEILATLIAGSDIVVESGKPGSLARLGFGYDRLKVLHPDIVLVSISNFGQTGPYRDLPASELVLYAMGHEMYGTGWAGEEPMSMAPGLNLCFAGQTAALAAATALLRQRLGGQGDWIDVSIMETFVSSIDRRADSLVAYAYTGEKMLRERQIEEGLLPPYTQCLDGLIHMTVKSQEAWRRLQAAVDEPWISDAPYPRGDPERTGALLAKWRDWCASRTRAEVVERCQSARVTCARVNSVADLFSDPQLGARGFFRPVLHPVVGEAHHAGLPFSVSEIDTAPWTPAPTLGQHSRPILSDIGYDAQEIDEMEQLHVI